MEPDELKKKLSNANVPCDTTPNFEIGTCLPVEFFRSSVANQRALNDFKLQLTVME